VKTMLKWMRKKILEGIVKNILLELPELKEKALILFEEKKDLFIEKAKEAIKEKLLELVKKL
jgi:hypothetical protein